MTVFITDDKWILNHGKLDKTDKEILEDAATGGEVQLMNLHQAMEMAKSSPEMFEGLDPNSQSSGVKLTPDKVSQLAEQASELAATLDKSFESLMNKDVATLIRKLRVEEHFTWRSIARRVHGTSFWCWCDPPSNQIAGICLSKTAAKLLGEDWNKEPWN